MVMVMPTVMIALGTVVLVMEGLVVAVGGAAVVTCRGCGGRGRQQWEMGVGGGGETGASTDSGAECAGGIYGDEHNDWEERMRMRMMRMKMMTMMAMTTVSW